MSVARIARFDYGTSAEEAFEGEGSRLAGDRCEIMFETVRPYEIDERLRSFNAP